MKVYFEKSTLMNAINTVLKAVPSKTNYKILECILIDARESYVKLTTNDTELGIETTIDARIEDHGITAINAKLFAEIIRKLPDSEILLQIKDNTALIKCESSKFKIMCDDPDTYIQLPQFNKEKSIVMSQYALKEVIRQTIFSISTSDTNPAMSGELFEVKENQLRVCSLDGHRISIRRVELSDVYPDFEVVVPGKSLSEVSKILTGEAEDEVRIFFSRNHISFEFDQTIVVSRLIDKKYFNVDQMLSNDYETCITVNKKILLDSIERSTLLVKESDKKPIIFNISDNSMELIMNSSLGSMRDEIMVNQFGKDIMIGFNPRFMIEALRVIDDEEVQLYTINAKAPCFIKDAEEKYIYLILPVNFNLAR
ncbi:MAG: DNA polymerase III subunit beta [Lachnospiraceae bacterium]|nr:DNA polymerase III subunit beta [Lachnospiraceae bacterium]